TMQQDAVELERGEAQNHADNAKPTPSRIYNLDHAQISSKWQDYSQPKTQQSISIIRFAASLNQKIRYQHRLRERDVQKRQAIDSSRQRYAQQESEPFLRTIRRLLGFPTQ